MAIGVQRLAAAEPVRISASRSALAATVGFLPLTVLLALVDELVATPRADRLLGTGAMLLVAAGVALFAGAVMGLVWRSRRADAVVGDATGLRVTSRRHGDRYLAWSEISELGWVSLPRVDTGLVARPTGAARAIWLCNPFGFKVHRGIEQLRELAETHGVAWRSDYTGGDVDPNLTRPTRWTRYLYGR